MLSTLGTKAPENMVPAFPDCSLPQLRVHQQFHCKLPIQSSRGGVMW